MFIVEFGLLVSENWFKSRMQTAIRHSEVKTEFCTRDTYLWFIIFNFQRIRFCWIDFGVCPETLRILLNCQTTSGPWAPLSVRVDYIYIFFKFWNQSLDFNEADVYLVLMINLFVNRKKREKNAALDLYYTTKLNIFTIPLLHMTVYVHHVTFCRAGLKMHVQRVLSFKMTEHFYSLNSISVSCPTTRFFFLWLVPLLFRVVPLDFSTSCFSS